MWVLETNLDDVPAETVGYVYERLLAAGALDVFTTPIYMKKNRPAMLLTVLASEASVPGMEEILFRETMTLGVRKYQASRSILPRREETVATPWGPVRGKIAWFRQDQPVFLARNSRIAPELPGKKTCPYARCRMRLKKRIARLEVSRGRSVRIVDRTLVCRIVDRIH